MLTLVSSSIVWNSNTLRGIAVARRPWRSSDARWTRPPRRPTWSIWACRSRRASLGCAWWSWWKAKTIKPSETHWHHTYNSTRRRWGNWFVALQFKYFDCSIKMQQEWAISKELPFTPFCLDSANHVWNDFSPCFCLKSAHVSMRPPEDILPATAWLWPLARVRVGLLSYFIYRGLVWDFYARSFGGLPVICISSCLSVIETWGLVFLVKLLNSNYTGWECRIKIKYPIRSLDAKLWLICCFSKVFFFLWFTLYNFHAQLYHYRFKTYFVILSFIDH